MSSNNAHSSGNNDFSLLEGLFQLALAGQTDDRIYQRLDNAVFERLLAQYAAEADNKTA